MLFLLDDENKKLNSKIVKAIAFKNGLPNKSSFDVGKYIIICSPFIFSLCTLLFWHKTSFCAISKIPFQSFPR